GVGSSDLVRQSNIHRLKNLQTRSDGYACHCTGKITAKYAKHTETNSRRFARIRGRKSPLPKPTPQSHHTGVGPCELSATARYHGAWKVPANHAKRIRTHYRS